MKVTNNDMPDDLLVKYLKGEAAPRESLLAEEWINANDANRQYYAQLKITMEPGNNQDASHATNNEEAWVRLQNLISKNHGGHIDKPEYWFKARWFQLVVTVILIAIISYFIRTRLYSNLTLKLTSGANVINDTLPDGTTFTLNTNSQILYPVRFTGSKRSVSLNGEAFFEIAADRSRSFIINLKDMVISTVGASVEVKNSNGQTVIAVVNGMVKINCHGKELLVNAGEKVSGNEGNLILIKEDNKGKNPAAWAIH